MKVNTMIKKLICVPDKAKRWEIPNFWNLEINSLSKLLSLPKKNILIYYPTLSLLILVLINDFKDSKILLLFFNNSILETSIK